MGSIRKLFSRASSLQKADFSAISVDVHSHLIPGIDDGSKSMDESISLVRRLCDLGFKKIITTPHVMSVHYVNSFTRINEGLKQLQIEIKKVGIPVQIEAAAEYLVDDQFEELYKSGDLISFGDRYVLIELSYYNENPRLDSIIFDLQVAGYKVVLAHPERYAYWHNDISKLQSLKERNVFFQLNTLSLIGYYSAAPKKIAEQLIARGWIDFIGTDTHNRNYISALQESLEQRNVQELLQSNRLLNKTLL